MAKSATEIMQEILFAALIDSVAALKAASRGVPNTLLRDLAAIHPNATFADLPPELQTAIGENVRSAFRRLQKEGYSVSTGEPVRQSPRPAPRRAPDRPRQPPGGPGRSPRKPGPNR